MTTIPLVVDLMTPQDINSWTYPSNSFAWPTCVTAHEFVCDFASGMKTVSKAAFRLNWAPHGNCVVRLVHCDDGPSNIVEICRVSSAQKPAGITIWNIVAPWFTDQFNALVAAKKSKSIGWQVQGGPVQFYSMRLEFLFND